MLDRLDETIVAISSAPGHGVLGIVRLSGPDALSIVDRGAVLKAGESLSDQPGFTRSTGEFLFDDDLSVPATFYVFRAPKSYTRQDLVEIHSLGSPSLLELVRQRLLTRGAVSAMPGEFTARAFLNGALDLASAEAVGGIIRAQSDTQLRAARRMMDGALARHIIEARDELAELLALVEAEIDFAEEPIDFITPGQLQDRLALLTDRLQRLLSGSQVSERLDQLPRILLFGRPNAGKSSLMNRLSGTRRSICAAAAGTTRDILSAPVVVGRGEALLLDTAGIDSSDDEIITAARQKAFDATQQVDLVCVVLDATIPEEQQLAAATASLESARWITAINKCDRLSDSAAAALLERVAHRTGRPVSLVSALEGRGIDTLRELLAQAVGTTQQSTASEAVLMTQRQSAAMSEAIDAIRRTQALCAVAADTLDCADLAAFELREALETLGAVTGAVTTEDLLGQVFARFCIGK